MPCLLCTLDQPEISWNLLYTFSSNFILWDRKFRLEQNEGVDISGSSRRDDRPGSGFYGVVGEVWSLHIRFGSGYPGSLTFTDKKKKSIRKRSLFLFYEPYLNSDGFLKVPPHIVIHINCNNLYNMYCLQVMLSIQKWIVWLYALNVKK